MPKTPVIDARADAPRGRRDGQHTDRVRPQDRRGRRAEGAALADLAWTLLEYRWTVAVALALGLGLAAVRIFFGMPSYDESVLVQVEGRTKTVPGFTDVSALFEGESPAEAEMRILTSRPLIESVVADLRLDVDVRPYTMPLLGDALARRHEGTALAPPRFGLRQFAWGGERLALQRLSVSDDLVGVPLVLTVLDGGRYEVTSPEHGLVATGQVDKPDPDAGKRPHADVLVTELVARPGARFVLTKRRTKDLVERLQTELRVTEQGKATGVVELSLSGSDPDRVANILNGIARAYIRQNVERTSAAATKTLQFLEAQLPALRARMDKAEAALNSFRASAPAVDLSGELGALLARASEVDKRISELEMEAADLRQGHTDQYPGLASVEERLRNLRAQRATVDARMKSLPGLELESVRLSRAARVATELYLNVQNRAQELRIVSAGWIGSVRVLEPAVAPTRPTSPKRAATVVIGVVLGLGAGFAAAFARKSLAQGVQDPDEIETETGVPVLGAIPRSSIQRSLDRHARRGPVEALSLVAPGDVTVEHLRNLRTSVEFAMGHAENRVVAVTAPAPRVGKSFVCVNLAHLFAAAGKRVVLVDADLRRGQLQRHFGVERGPGLSEVLLGTASLEVALRPTDVPNLSLLATGALPPHPAELASSPLMEKLLADLSRRHEVVIVDTPPILSVTDSALVGRYAGLNLLVLRAGAQSLREIAFTLRRLDRSGVPIRGAILNDVRPSRGRYGRNGAYRLYSA